MINKILTRHIMCIRAYLHAIECIRQKDGLAYNGKRKTRKKLRGGESMDNYTGTNLRTLREFFGETQDELAESVNVSSVAISYYENDHRSPDIEMTKNLASHYWLTMDQLVSGDFSLLSASDGFPDMTVDLTKVARAIYPFADLKTDNESFRRGYAAAQRIIRSMNSEAPVMESLADHVIRQFETAMDETGAPEATANYLLALMMKRDFLANDQLKAKNKKLYSNVLINVNKEFVKKNCLNTETISNEEDETRKSEFLKQYGEVINEKVRELKKTPGWIEFAEYYQGLRYLTDMMDTNRNSREQNISIGLEIMINLWLAGNKYAVYFLEGPVV